MPLMGADPCFEVYNVPAAARLVLAHSPNFLGVSFPWERERRLQEAGGARGARGAREPLVCPQSVSALVDKFKKHDQVFDINAEVEESGCGDFPEGPLEDDFDANDEPEPTSAGDREELRSWREPCQVQSSQ